MRRRPSDLDPRHCGPPHPAFLGTAWVLLGLHGRSSTACGRREMNGVQLLLVVIAAITVTGLAHRKGLQAPLVVLVIGLAASFIPGMPRLELEPHIILGIVLPPLLYSTALDFSVPS